jgi:hypothetical protein
MRTVQMWSIYASLATACSFFAAAPQSEPSTQVKPTPPSLTGEVLQQDFCLGDGEMNVQRLRIELSVTNESDGPITVPVVSSVVDNISIAADRVSLSQGRLESKFDPELISESLSTATEPKSITLGPKQKVTLPVVIEISIPITSGDARIAGITAPGSHVIAFRWHVWRRRNSQLPSQWREATGGPKSDIWLRPLVSKPISFVTPAKPQLRECRQS